MKAHKYGTMHMPLGRALGQTQSRARTCNHPTLQGRPVMTSGSMLACMLLLFSAVNLVPEPRATLCRARQS